MAHRSAFVALNILWYKLFGAGFTASFKAPNNVIVHGYQDVGQPQQQQGLFKWNQTLVGEGES